MVEKLWPTYSLVIRCNGNWSSYDKSYDYAQSFFTIIINTHENTLQLIMSKILIYNAQLLQLLNH